MGYQGMTVLAVASIAAYFTIKKMVGTSKASSELARKMEIKGDVAVGEKKWAEAISYYSTSIKSSHDTATYYIKRAASYMESKCFRLAKKDCNRAISLGEKSATVYLLRGMAKEMMGFKDEANEDFRYASYLNSHNQNSSSTVPQKPLTFSPHPACVINIGSININILHKH
ncbi:amidase [Ranunculus cassubicifolius]